MTKTSRVGGRQGERMLALIGYLVVEKEDEEEKDKEEVCGRKIKREDAACPRPSCYHPWNFLLRFSSL